MNTTLLIILLAFSLLQQAFAGQCEPQWVSLISDWKVVKCDLNTTVAQGIKSFSIDITLKALRQTFADAKQFLIFPKDSSYSCWESDYQEIVKDKFIWEVNQTITIIKNITMPKKCLDLSDTQFQLQIELSVWENCSAWIIQYCHRVRGRHKFVLSFKNQQGTEKIEFLQIK